MDKKIKDLVARRKYEEAIRLLEGEETLKLMQQKYDDLVKEYGGFPYSEVTDFDEFMALEAGPTIKEYKKPDYSKVKDWDKEAEAWANNFFEAFEGDCDVELQIATPGKRAEAAIWADELVLVDFEKFKKGTEYAVMFSITPFGHGAFSLSVFYSKREGLF